MKKIAMTTIVLFPALVFECLGCGYGKSGGLRN